MNSTDPSPTDPEAALDHLVAAGVVDETDDGLVTTADFEATRGIYRDTYADADEERFRQTVAETFGVDRAQADAQIDAGDLTRDDLVAYLALRSFLDDVDGGALATMAALVVELGPGSPVPDAVTELDDEEWADFLADEPEAVVTVWTHDCAPCEALKRDLDSVLASLPDGVAVAGVDGASVPAFRRRFGVDSAPAVCCFRDGDLRETVTGRRAPETYADAFASVF